MLAVALSLGTAVGSVLPAQAGFVPGFVNTEGVGLELAVGDVNGDGKVDLVAALSDFATLSLGHGDGTFDNRRLVATNVPNPTALVLADLNGDGKLDLATTGSGVVVNLGNGDGTFQTPNAYTTDAAPLGIAAIDLNGDGKLDLVTFNRLGGNISVLIGQGNGTFPTHVEYAGGSPIDAFTTVPPVVADLNGDGKLDVAVPDQFAQAVALFLGNGDGTFQTSQLVGVGFALQSPRAADLNGDGKVDLLGSVRGQEKVALLLGNGGGTFQAPKLLATGAQPLGTIAVDFNVDGKPDIVTADRSGSITVLLGNGDGTFQPKVSFSSDPSGLKWMTAADLNGDGRPDLVAAINVTLGTAGSLVFLNDRPATIQFIAATGNVSESGGTAQLQLTRTGVVDGPVSALVSVTGGTANPVADFTFPAPQSVAWDSGDNATKTVTVPIINDPINEGGETVQFTVSLPNSATWGTVGSPATTIVTIADDDLTNVSIANASAPEGNSGTTSLIFPVTLTGAASTQTITVQYATATASATAGSDYTATSGTLTFAPGETTKTISVPILGDTVPEPDETFTVTLSNPTNATLGTTQAIGVIQNDDTACSPRPRVTQSLASGGGALNVTVSPTPQNDGAANTLQRIVFGTLQNATVTLNGAAVADGQTVTLPAGATSASLEVRRASPGAATTVPFTVVDTCGEWKTFVGGGTGAGF